jgi:hypothetical protein
MAEKAPEHSQYFRVRSLTAEELIYMDPENAECDPEFVRQDSMDGLSRDPTGVLGEDDKDPLHYSRYFYKRHDDHVYTPKPKEELRQYNMMNFIMSCTTLIMFGGNIGIYIQGTRCHPQAGNLR